MGSAGALLAAAEGDEGLAADPPLSDWSLAMAPNIACALGAGTTRALLLGSAMVCMVVKVMRSVGTLATSADRPRSEPTLPRLLSTVRALVAAFARLYRAVGSVRVPALFILRMSEDRNMCWA